MKKKLGNTIEYNPTLGKSRRSTEKGAAWLLWLRLTESLTALAFVECLQTVTRQSHQVLRTKISETGGSFPSRSLPSVLGLTLGKDMLCLVSNFDTST
jgi:hypothetical protein